MRRQALPAVACHRGARPLFLGFQPALAAQHLHRGKIGPPPGDDPSEIEGVRSVVCVPKLLAQRQNRPIRPADEIYKRFGSISEK
jgi:hypothetical protein